MYLRLAAILGVLTFATVACSIVDDGRVERVSPPAELTDTLPPTTIAATTTEAATTTSGLETTTTEVQADTVLLYYISSGKLSPLVGSLSSQYAPSQLMALLQAGPIDDPISIGLRNAIPADVEIDASQDGTGVAQVILPEGFFDTIPAGDQRLAVAQIVMTLLGNIPGVGQVAFFTLFQWIGLANPGQGSTLCTAVQIYTILFNCFGAIFYVRFKRQPGGLDLSAATK